jgi:ABC-type Zn uptake system ZnuABC Zn-binding protein ZnuA
MALRRLTALLLLLFFVAGISIVGAQEEPLKVVATYSILGDIVQNIAGDNIKLTILVGPDGDSHVYEPTPQDAIALAEADLIFENGLEFETWLDDLYESSGSTATRIVVSDGIEPLAFEEHDHEDEHAHEDEHMGEDEHAHEHEEVVDLSPWAGEWVTGWSFGVEAMQPAFDAILAVVPELTRENIFNYYEAGNQSAFDTFSVEGDQVTFVDASGTATCAYSFGGNETVIAFPTELWSLFSTDDEACAAYRYLLLMPPHSPEPGSSPHAHFRYGSTSFEELIADDSAWYPSIYPAGTTSEQVTNAWITSARMVGLYIASVQGIEVALTEEEQAAAQSETDPHEGEDHHDHEHGEFDPHIWHDPNNGIVMVANIRDALVEADPTNAEAYTANAETYTAQLTQLDTYIREQVATIPAANRILVTSHDTFGYFADEYGFVVLNVLGSVSTDAADPGAGEIAELVAEIQASGVPAIFTENVTNPALVEQVANEAGVIVAPTLYTDALGQPGTPGETYLSMLRYNVDTIAEALR